MFVAEDVVYVDGLYYFAAKEINAICSFNENDGQIRVLRTDDSGDIWAYRRYGRVFKYKRQLVFLPLWAPNILMYDIDKNNFKTVQVREKKGFSTDYFFAGRMVEDRLVMVGCQYPAIAVLNLTNMNLNYYEEPYKKLMPLHKEGGDCFFRCDVENVDSKIYAASCLSNHILEFDIIDGSFVWHEVGSESNTYSGIAYDGKYFWISPRRGIRAVCWNKNENKVKEFDLPFEYKSGEEKEKCTTLGAIYDGSCIYFAGMDIERSFVINPNNVDFESNIRTIDKSYTFFNQHEGLIFALNRKGELEVFNAGDHYNPVKVVRTTNDKRLIAKFIHDTGEMIHEGYKDIGLNDFIKMVKL